MRTQYVAEKKSHWSFGDRLHELSAVHGLARRVKARKRVNTILGACLLASVVGKPALQVLGEAGKKVSVNSRVGVRVEL